MSADINVSTVRAQVVTAASNLPLALTIKIVKGAEGTLCNVPYAYPDISAATIRARAMAVGAAAFPLTWNRSYAPAINASSNTLFAGVTDSQLVVSGSVGYGSNSVLMSRYLQDYGASISLLQTSNRYYLVSTEGGNTFFSVGTSNDGRLTYGLSNSAFGVSTACVMQQTFGLGTCNLAVGLCNPVLGSVAPTLKSVWNLSNVKYYPRGAWNLKPPIVAAGGQSYTDSNFGLAVALSNYTSFPDTALSFSITSNTNAAVPFSTTGNFANVLTLSGGHAAVAAGSNTGTLTLSVVNSLDTTGFAVACNVDVPYTVFALAPVGTTVTPSSLKLGTTGTAYTLSNLAGYVTARAGGAYTYAVMSGSNPYGNVSVDAATGALTISRLTSNVSYAVGVKVTDQFSQSNTQAVPLISVRPPDALGAPSALTLGSTGSAYLLSGFPGYFATQPLGDPYVYSVVTNPKGNVSVNASTGALTIARLGINATYTAGVRLTDGVSQSVTQSIVLTSVPPATVNGALNAVVKSSSNSSFPTFSSVGFNVMTGGTYSYALTANQLNNAVVDAGTGALTVTGVSGCNAVYSVGVSAIDQFSQSSQRLVTLTSVPPLTAKGGLTASVKSSSNILIPTFGNVGFNLMTGGTYVYSLTSNQLTNAAINAGTGALTVTGVSGCNAVYSVGVSAVDQFSQSSQTFIALTSVPPATVNTALSAVVKSLSNVSLPTFGGSAGFNLMTGGTYVYSLTTNQLTNAAVDAGTGALTVTGVSGCNAVYSVGVSAVDQFSQASQRLITLTSVPPPSANGVLAATVKSLSNVSLPTFGSSGFNLKTGGTYVYSLTTDQLSNAVVDAGTGALTVTGVSGCNAVYSVGITAVDQFSQSVQQTIALTSVPPPTANGALSAVVKSLSNVSLPTFGSSGFNLKTGGTYVYSVTTNQLSNASVVAGTGALTVTGVSGCNAVYSVGITAVDQFSQSDQKVITLTSVPPPTANGALTAVVQSLSNVSLPTFGGTTGFNLKTGGTYVYSVTTNQLSNAVVDAGTGSLNVTGVSGCNAVFSVGVTAIDQFSQAAQRLVTLTSVPPPTANVALAAVVQSLSNVSLPTFGGSSGFNLKTGGTYVYSVTTNQLSNAIVDAGTGALTVTGVSGCNAVYSVGITAVDQFSQSDQRLVTLTSVPPPTLNGVLAAVVQSLSNVSLPTFGISGFNLKTGGTYVYSLTTNQLSNASVVVGTGALTVTGVSGCNTVYSVGVTAVDQFSQSVQQTIALTSVPPPTANGALTAVVKSLSNVSLPTFGGTTGFNLKTGGTYVYSVTTNQLSNAIVDAGTGSLNVAGVSGCNAVYSVGVTAIDQFSQAAQRLVTLTSVPPPTANLALSAVVQSLSNVSLPTFGGSSGFNLKTGGAYTYSLTTNQLSNAVVDAGTGALTVTGVSGCNAVYSVGITAVDQFSQSDQRSITLTSVPPPTPNGVLAATVRSLSNVSLPTFGSSGFNLKTGGTYVYSLTTNQLSNASVVAGTGALTVTGVSGCNSVYSVGVTAVDQFSQSVQQTIALTSVIPPAANGAPTAVTLGTTGAAYLLAGFASYFTTQPGGTPYVYSITTNPSGNVSVNSSTGAVTIARLAVNATYTAVVTLTDGLAQSVTQSIGLTSVLPPAVTSAFPASTIDSSATSYSLNVASYFFSTGTIVSYTVTSNPQNNASFSGGMLTVNRAYTGTTYNVVVTATDQFSQTSVGNTLVVNDAAALYSLNGGVVGTVAFGAGSTYGQASVAAASVASLFSYSGVPVITYSLFSTPYQNATVAAGGGALTVYNAGSGGSYTVLVKATNGTLTAYSTLTVTESAIAPTVAIALPQIALAANNRTFQLSTACFGGVTYVAAGASTYSLTTNPYVSAVVSAQTGYMTVTGATRGQLYTVSVRATNASGQFVDASLSVVEPPVGSGLLAVYTGESWSTTGGGWLDAYGANHATTVTGTVVKTATGINGRAYLSGGYNTSTLQFPSAVLPSTYTLFSLSKYNGAVKGRVLTAPYPPTNWLTGHYSGVAGVAFHDGWVADTVFSGIGSNWLLSSDQNTLYKCNGLNRSTGSGSAYATGIGFNVQSETSDWASAFVLVYTGTLSAAEIVSVEAWIAGIYNIPLALSGVPATTLTLGASSTIQLSSYFSGAPTSYGYTVTSGTAPTGAIAVAAATGALVLSPAYAGASYTITPVATNATSMAVGKAFTVSDPQVTTQSGWLSQVFMGYFADVVSFFATATLLQSVYTTDTTNLSTCTNAYLGVNNAVQRSVQMTGFYLASATGTYTITLAADDAAYIWLGNNAIAGFTTGNATINNGGLHEVVLVTGTYAMTAGYYYPVRVQFGDSGGGSDLQISFTPPGGVQTYVGTGAYFAPPDGSSAVNAAASAAAIKTLTGTNVDGVYWINLPTVGPTQVYCIMDSAVSGGGWMLALKASATGTTFYYASPHWTTATTTLNPTDTTRGAGDAKFDTFNYFSSADMMAIWPDITTTGGTISLPASYGSWCWLKTAYNSGTRQALASFFSTASNVSFGTAVANPPRFPEAGANIFSQQAGNAFYGANFTLYAPASVRWGFAFNNETDWVSNDVIGGIGLGTYGGKNYSSGDVYGCCEMVVGINRQARVEMYVR